MGDLTHGAGRPPTYPLVMADEALAMKREE